MAHGAMVDRRHIPTCTKERPAAVPGLGESLWLQHAFKHVDAVATLDAETQLVSVHCPNCGMRYSFDY